MTRLHLGCGADYRQGYKNIDFYSGKDPTGNQIKADVFLDLNKLPYPFDILLELHRICKSGAEIKLVVPHFSSGNAWGDLQHKRPFSLTSFFNKDIQDYFEVIDWYIDFNLINTPWEFILNKNIKLAKAWEYYLSGIIRSGDIKIKLKCKR